MRGLLRLTRTELLLLRRDAAAIILPFALPVGLLVGFGSAASFREPDPAFGGMSAFDVFIVPVALVLVIAMMSLQIFPVHLSGYRERGVLRRMATTPLHPLAVLLAQLLVHLGVVVASLALTALVAGAVYEVSAPRSPAAALGVLALGLLALYAMAVAVAALAPKASAATALGMGLFFPQLLLGGLMVPADALPEALARIGELTPVGAALGALQDAWLGAGVAGLHLGVLAVWTVAAVALAVTRFRWG
jgi:ABC-2 type transport system permease protein